MSQLLGNVQAGWEETTLVSLSSIYTLFVGWLESACLSSNLITLFHFLISKVAESQGYLNISNLNVTKKNQFFESTDYHRLDFRRSLVSGLGSFPRREMGSGKRRGLIFPNSGW